MTVLFYHSSQGATLLALAMAREQWLVEQGYIGLTKQVLHSKDKGTFRTDILRRIPG
jgi:hypothetical protein